jgi:hypothetical protein
MAQSSSTGPAELRRRCAASVALDRVWSTVTGKALSLTGGGGRGGGGNSNNNNNSNFNFNFNNVDINIDNQDCASGSSVSSALRRQQSGKAGRRAASARLACRSGTGAPQLPHRGRRRRHDVWKRAEAPVFHALCARSIGDG